MQPRLTKVNAAATLPAKLRPTKEASALRREELSNAGRVAGPVHSVVAGVATARVNAAVVGSVREAVVGDVGGAERGEATGAKGLTTERSGGEDTGEQTEPRRRAL